MEESNRECRPNTQCDFEFGNSFNDPITFLSVARTLEVSWF